MTIRANICYIGLVIVIRDVSSPDMMFNEDRGTGTYIARSFTNPVHQSVGLVGHGLVIPLT